MDGQSKGKAFWPRETNKHYTLIAVLTNTKYISFINDAVATTIDND